MGHQTCGGNRQSNVRLAEERAPHALGALIALYEHSIFPQGVIWNIDSFEQWGVELGKALAQRIIPRLTGPDQSNPDHDSSTRSLIQRYRRLRDNSP